MKDSWKIIIQRLLSFFSILLITSGCIEKRSFDEQDGAPPVDRIRVTKRDGVVAEVFVTLRDGIRLTNVLDIDLFDGFTPGVSLDYVTASRGWPDGTNTVSELGGLPLQWYSNTHGRVGYIRIPRPKPQPPEWQLWGLPSKQTVSAVVKDESLKQQLAELVTGNLPIRVHVIRNGGGGVTLCLRGKTLDSLILTARD